MKIIAIIPARGGSKRLPRKNIKPFCGKPMIAWSIDVALKSGCFNHIIVSTDDSDIAEVARTYGAEVPFLRPPELSDDHTGTIPVIAHAINWQQQHGETPTAVCCIYPTAPLLQPNFLREGLELLETHPDADFAFSVTSYAFPIFRALKQNTDGFIGMFWPENELTRSQDLPEAWHDAGQFYWGRPAAFQRHKGVFSAHSLPVRLPRHLVQDIDTPEDWERAEYLFRALQDNSTSGCETSANA